MGAGVNWNNGRINLTLKIGSESPHSKTVWLLVTIERTMLPEHGIREGHTRSGVGRSPCYEEVIHGYGFVILTDSDAFHSCTKTAELPTHQGPPLPGVSSSMERGI